MSDPRRLGDILRSVLSGLGVPDPGVWADVEGRWSEVVGSPWDTQSRPVALSGGVLVVEAISPAAVSILRYGVTSLEATLRAAFGPDVVREVKVRAPAR